MKCIWASCLLLIGLLFVQAQAADIPAALVKPDVRPALPQANGPFGNFNPRQYGVTPIDDLPAARQLWVSKATDLGRAKRSASGYVDMLADPKTHAGSASGLIVAEGKVFASSFHPRGDARAEKMPHLARSLGNYTGERLVALQRSTALDADDLTVAVDFATGRTRWKAVEEGKGVNRAAQHHQGPRGVHRTALRGRAISDAHLAGPASLL